MEDTDESDPPSAFYYRFFTIPIVKCTFFLLRKIRFKKERFTIGIVKLPIVKRSVPAFILKQFPKKLAKFRTIILLII